MASRWTQAKMRGVAEEEREELGLAWSDPLDPYALAEKHGIPVYSINDLIDDGCRSAVDHFTQGHQHAWSAALVPIGRRRLIIENTAHPPVRRRSNIAHELGHHLLEHDFDQVLLTDEGCRRFDSDKEKQAKFISAELLIPNRAAMRAAYDGLTNEQMAERFKVSTQFAQMCMSGPRVVARRVMEKQTRR